MGVIHQPPGLGLWLSDPGRQASGMRMIQIIESYERGVFVLRDSAEPYDSRVGGEVRMLREADRRTRGQTASVLVINTDRNVRKCLRYRPDGSVEEERPESIYWDAV